MKASSDPERTVAASTDKFKNTMIRTTTTKKHKQNIEKDDGKLVVLLSLSVKNMSWKNGNDEKGSKTYAVFVATLTRTG